MKPETVRNVATTKADETNKIDVKAYVEKAKEQLGSIDLFFNNAGVEGESLQ